MNSASRNIEVSFHGTIGTFAIDVAFTAPMRGITALFGASGCGKTTVLRCAAGLQRLSGRLTVGDEVWQDDAAGIFRKPYERRVGYVFQEASLFPHLSVRKNLLYGALRAANRSNEQAIQYDDVVELLGVRHLLERGPLTLSGGERQRIAIGRALLSQPRLLLMDEPLAALDRLTKDEILPYLEALHAKLSIPILYVSHDIAEVDRLADTMVLMENGRVIAAGPIAELESNPGLPFLRAPDAAVTLDGTVTGFDEAFSLMQVAVPGGALTVPGFRGEPGNHKRLRVRTTDVSFSRVQPAQTTILNCLPARILSVNRAEGHDAFVHILAALGTDGGGARLVGRVTRRSQAELELAPGMPVFAQIKSVALAGGTGTGRNVP